MATFRRFIATPFDESEERRVIASQRFSLLLDSVCLRRTKDLLDLPEKQDRTRTLELSKEERDQYEQTKRVMIRAIRQRVGECDRKSVFGMFQAQLQLRIFCNHGTFQDPFSWAKRNLLNEREDALCAIGRDGEIKCSSCGQSMPILGSNKVRQAYTDNCAHVLCSECLEESTQDSGEKGNATLRCPLCLSVGEPMAAAAAECGHSGRDGPHDDYFRPQGHSSKVTALMSDVRENLWANKRQVL
jgi:hypothetical protein